MLQTMIASLIVIAASAWLLRRALRTLRAVRAGDLGGASGCGTCSRNPASSKPQVIELGKRSSGSENNGR
jgi:hypothetical protein